MLAVGAMTVTAGLALLPGPSDSAARTPAAATAGAGGHERLDGFVALRDVDPSIAEDMRYAGAHNFTRGAVDGYEEPVCLLARRAAEALRRAQRELLRGGYSLKVYDCYRPRRAVRRFVRWAAEPDDPAAKAEHYPEVAKSRLVPEGYIASESAHSRGSTVDVTLVALPARREVDMGTAFDFFDPRAHTDAPGTPPGARENRRLLRRVLGARGFVNLPQEWWHFTLRPEAFPGTGFDVPVSVAAGRP
ncbi:M15 family metallopeptidase [Streptomyces sp. NPDC048507]|uniref:M15 family metallopeptidase n=1 Tax=Streptomyces sp. NPDC048507 TaxID=3365560 RepID=UPI0037229D90